MTLCKRDGSLQVCKKQRIESNPRRIHVEALTIEGTCLRRGVHHELLARGRELLPLRRQRAGNWSHRRQHGRVLLQQRRYGLKGRERGDDGINARIGG